MSSIGPFAFSVEEYRRRLCMVQDVMRARHLDWAILDEPETMGWVSGYAVQENLWRACLVPVVGAPFLLIRKLDVAPARAKSWLQDIVAFSDWEEPVSVLAAALRSRGAHARIGVDFQSHSFTRQRQDLLERALPQSSFCDLERAVWDARRCKSDEEVEHFRVAASLLDRAVLKVTDAIRPGSSQRDVAAVAAAEYYRLGFDDGFVGYVAAGSDWDCLHNSMNDEPLDDGAVVHIELLPKLKGYSARIMRSAVMGRATEDQKSTFATLCALQDEQFRAMRPGAVAADVDAIVRQGVLSAGLRPDYENITGYTLGFSAPSSQRVSDLYRSFVPTATWLLEKGMVFHMYTSARGLAVSETVLVTESGAERLTRTPRKIFETGVKA
ncbi:M24 family metallopeptidase [Variovorax paradoxus]|uniref:M24 family metallopeptidase n=1 Tax=Variovorax paradoxus TaxID=34073 RepID=UPI003D65E84A